MDEESNLVEGEVFQFDDKSVRRGFIRKVYAILSLQLIVTAGVIAALRFPPAARKYMIQNGGWVWGVSLAGTLVFSIILSCCGDVRRKWPINVICLAIFTVFMSVFLGAVTSTYDSDAVLMAAGVTIVISCGLTIFAMQTKCDFTACSGVLLVLLMALFGFGLICAIVQTQFATIAYASLGAVIFGLYIVMDTQMILGGKHRYATSPEEYVFAALNLYIDVIQLFLFLLVIIQGSKH